MRKQLKLWLSVASDLDKRELARTAGVTGSMIRLVSRGKAKATARWSAKVERAARIMQQKNPLLPTLDRTDICITCSRCPYPRQLRART